MNVRCWGMRHPRGRLHRNCSPMIRFVNKHSERTPGRLLMEGTREQQTQPSLLVKSSLMCARILIARSGMGPEKTDEIIEPRPYGQDKGRDEKKHAHEVKVYSEKLVMDEERDNR